MKTGITAEERRAKQSRAEQSRALSQSNKLCESWVIMFSDSNMRTVLTWSFVTVYWHTAALGLLHCVVTPNSFYSLEVICLPELFIYYNTFQYIPEEWFSTPLESFHSGLCFIFHRSDCKVNSKKTTFMLQIDPAGTCACVYLISQSSPWLDNVELHQKSGLSFLLEPSALAALLHWWTTSIQMETLPDLCSLLLITVWG